MVKVTSLRDGMLFMRTNPSCCNRMIESDAHAHVSGEAYKQENSHFGNEGFIMGKYVGIKGGDSCGFFA